MDAVKWKWKKVFRGWKRCRSPGGVASRWSTTSSLINTFSYSIRRTLSENEKWKQVASEGTQKQRFVVRTEIVNHPLFKKLLEDAEMEYGFCNEGPILLPCEADSFYKVLAEIEINSDDHIKSRNYIVVP